MDNNISINDNEYAIIENEESVKAIMRINENQSITNKNNSAAILTITNLLSGELILYPLFVC
jgi:hypothetical protein